MKPKGIVFDKRVHEVTEAAARLFSSQGYLETSMNEIAVAARLSKGGMYHYFNSKAEILAAILSDFMDRVLDDIENELLSIEDPGKKLFHLIRRHVDIYANHMHAARTLLKEANNLSLNDLREIEAKERRYYAVTAQVVGELIGPHAEKDTLKAVTFSLLGMCNWIFSWYDPGGAISPERLSEIIFSVFTNGARSIESDTPTAL